MKMFLVSNGITCMALVNYIAGSSPFTAMDLTREEYTFYGYCVTAITLPTETGSNTSLIHAANIADFSDAGGKDANLKKSYVIKTTPESFIWAKDVDERSELYAGVKKVLGLEEKPAVGLGAVSIGAASVDADKPEPKLDIKKLAKIKDMLESLSPEEIKALTGGK